VIGGWDESPFRADTVEKLDINGRLFFCRKVKHSKLLSTLTYVSSPVAFSEEIVSSWSLPVCQNLKFVTSKINFPSRKI
jgi:hypothetical protein